jgi:glycosyltransferase involved in cell wall biosynthesis
MTKFSVVMPVYSELTPQLEGNAGHLHYRGGMVQRAIKSIINQQFPDWELILVNDGSPDPSIAPYWRSSWLSTAALK